MNVSKFKEEINSQPIEIKEAIKKFKHSVEISIDGIIRSKELYYKDIYKQNAHPEEYLSDQEYKYYTEISASHLIDISAQLSRKIKNSTEAYDGESDSLYSYYSIDYVNEFFKGVDEAEFFYGIVRFSNFFGEANNYFGGDLYRKVFEYINYWELTELSKMIEYKKSVFIAMSFSNNLNKARESIKKAIERFDYLPLLIDEKEHSNFIVPEVIKEIEKCEFLIADFTENKRGVYYEAGIGKGLNKVVIHTCKDTKKDKENLHFDVKDINTIFWNDEDELSERIIRRIGSMTK